MEKLLHYVWQHRLLPPHELRTTDGQRLEIIDSGTPNGNAGPDFFNARVRIDSVLWSGNIEIHTRASDWYRHGHEHDETYANTILHVIEVDDTPLLRTSGERVTQFVLTVSRAIRARYEALSLPFDVLRPVCSSVLADIDEAIVRQWLSELSRERLKQKISAIEERLGVVNGDWEHAFFITLARSFGFGVNSEAFEQWSRRIPSGVISKNSDKLHLVEALFFGMAGLLPDDRGDDEYISLLRREYNYLCTKYSLTAVISSQCRMLRIRPAGFPHLRIAQLATLYTTHPFLFSQLMKAPSIDAIVKLLNTEVSGYWRTHLHFGSKADARNRTLSISAIHLLIINTVIPFLYAYGKYRGDHAQVERALNFLSALPAENNNITRRYAQLGINCLNAADSQAVIQLQRAYCEPRKCISCTFGHHYMQA